jgi:hypothetical protein
MTPYRQSYADRYEAPPSAFRSRRRANSVVAEAVRTLNLTVADALYAYAVTGSAFATLLVLAAPHLELLCAASSMGKDEPAARNQLALSGQKRELI